MKRRTFEDVIQIDDALRKLSIYEVSKGMLLLPTSMEEAFEFQQKVINKFNYFKRLIQNGSVSFEQIKCYILDQNGPFKKQRKLTIDELLINIQQCKQDDIEEEEGGSKSFSESILQNFLKESGFLKNQSSKKSLDE